MVIFLHWTERRVLPIVRVCLSSSHLHIFSSSNLLIFTSSHLHMFSSSHLLIFTSSHLHIFSSSSHIHILISLHPHIFTSSHLHILSSLHPHIFTSSHLHITFSHCCWSLGPEYCLYEIMMPTVWFVFNEDKYQNYFMSGPL